MKPDEFRRDAIRLVGDGRGWQSRCADRLGIDQGTMSRYLSGTVPVGTPVALLLQCLLNAEETRSSFRARPAPSKARRSRKTA